MNREVILEVNGVPWKGFTSVNVSNDIEQVSGEFNFQATSEKKLYLPFKGQEKCRVLVDGVPLITGFIEEVNYSYDNDSHSISVSGRDKTSDLIDSSIAGNIEFRGGILLEGIVGAVLSFLGIDSKVINNVGEGQINQFTKEEIETADVGENAFKFIEKYARKRGVLLSTDGDANIVLSRSSGEEINGTIVNKINNNANNVKSASVVYRFAERFNKYIVRGQGNPVALSQNNLTTEKVEGNEGTAIDEDIRETRILEFQPETSSSAPSSQIRADWESNIRRSRSFVYKCVLTDIFIGNNELLVPNKLIRVIDDMCDIDAIMLIKSVNFTFSNSGTNVILELVQKDSYTLIPTRNKYESKYMKVGEDVVSYQEQ